MSISYGTSYGFMKGNKMYDVFCAWASVTDLLAQIHHCSTSPETAVELFNEYFSSFYGEARIVLIPDEDREDALQIKVGEVTVEQRNLDGRITHSVESFCFR